MSIPVISIVSPVYKAKKILPKLVERITTNVSSITDDFEIILVDDCCPENSWELIEKECLKNNKIKGLKLSRNFGQHFAITAGLDHSSGQWVIVMDCDLQDLPEEIPNLYRKAQEGFEIVYARRLKRKDAFLKVILSWIFYKLFSYLSGIKYDGTIASFGIYSRKVISNVNKFREPMRAFSPIVRWIGFKSTIIEVTHGNRYSGSSSYDIKRLIKLSLDIILAYSDKPLRLTIKLGFFISFSSLLYSLFIFIIYLQGGIKVSGYTSLIISVWFLSGLIIFILGIIGLYISKIFESVKNRPLYIIEEKINYE
jgi:glycosyltransferase involved in cell wall biosynthesis